jgi:hypothetical protein
MELSTLTDHQLETLIKTGSIPDETASIEEEYRRCLLQRKQHREEIIDKICFTLFLILGAMTILGLILEGFLE